MTGLPEFKRITDEGTHIWDKELPRFFKDDIIDPRYELETYGIAVANKQLLSCQQQLADWVKQTPGKVREELILIIQRYRWGKMPPSYSDAADQILSLLALQHEAGNTKLRELLWAAHRCEGKYGDDGELQCGNYLPPIDFKRDSVLEIEKKVALHNLARMPGHPEHEAKMEKARQEGREEVARWLIQENQITWKSLKNTPDWFRHCGLGISDEKWQHQLSVWGITGQ